MKLIDEDDVAENDRHAKITTDSEEPTAFDGDNFEIKKKATGKLKERNVLKIRSRRARQVTHTEKLRSINEDDVQDNDGHADFTTNYNLKNKLHNLKTKASTSSGDTGFLDQNIGENCEIEKKAATGKWKRKQRGNKEHEEMDETWEPDSSRVDGDCGAILTNETSIIDHVLMNEHCSSQDGPQVKTHKIWNVYSRRSKHNRNENDPKISCTKRSIRKKSCCYRERGVVQLEDEETLGSFLSKLKKRRLQRPEE